MSADSEFSRVGPEDKLPDHLLRPYVKAGNTPGSRPY